MGPPYFHVHWVQQLLIIFPVFPICKNSSHLVVLLGNTQVVICAILRGPQARVIKTILLLSFCYHVRNFFWLLLIKRCPLPTKVRSFALNFMGTGSSNENNVGDFEFAWWRGPAVYEWVHTCLRQIYNLNFPFTFQSMLGKFLPRSGTEFMQF